MYSRRNIMAKAKSRQKSKTMSKQNIKRRRVSFSFESADAREVILVGDFNNWNLQKHAMKHNGDGTWNKTVMLAPGRYEYKFFVDGNWKIDPQNGQTSSNSFGTQNSVLNLEKR
jgi:5'-AMP-activated protein kinase regulatory beta subunit